MCSIIPALIFTCVIGVTFHYYPLHSIEWGVKTESICSILNLFYQHRMECNLPILLACHLNCSVTIILQSVCAAVCVCAVRVFVTLRRTCQLNSKCMFQFWSVCTPIYDSTGQGGLTSHIYASHMYESHLDCMQNDRSTHRFD